MSDHPPLGLLGADVAEVSEEEVPARLDAGCVHLSVDPDLAGACLTVRVAITTLLRMPGRVHLDPRGIDAGEIAAMLKAATRIDSVRGLEVGESVPEGAVHLHIGTTPPSSAAIRVVPDGYGVHVARDAASNIMQARPPHPLGCVVAATFGVAEAFKDLE